MYEELINKLRELPHLLFVQLGEHEDVVYQAADAIEELRKAVLRLEDESGIYDELPTFYIYPTKWIPVTERLPETRTRCVTISRDGDYGLGVYTTDYGWMFPYYMGKTTHWMPLPEPPKEET